MPVSTDQTLTIVRNLNADPMTVYNAWMDPNQRKQWFTPSADMMTCTNCTIDAKVGGQYRMKLVTNEGDKEYHMGGEFRELDPGNKIIFTWKSCSESDNDPAATCTVTLKPTKTGTEMTFIQVGFANDESRNDQTQGWNGCFTTLEQYVDSE
ncbi:SRPBCC family protein [Poriferisphaera sp. WC338]|uniref:SRPBCC family protein n=1 Tax=Poriferisphaera sp. WC338 TaxID=3425129 RepID=UPI003D819A2D